MIFDIFDENIFHDINYCNPVPVNNQSWSAIQKISTKREP